MFGVDFFSVLSRGSQFKVEAFMFRLAKPESFVLPSPSREDVCPSFLLILGFINILSIGWKTERCRVYTYDNVSPTAK